jgi:hypothetical protein
MTKSIKLGWIALAMALAVALAMSPSLWADEIHEAAGDRINLHVHFHFLVTEGKVGYRWGLI